MREEILSILEKNSKIDIKELAVMLGTNEETVFNEITDMEREGIICGYHTLIDWDKIDNEKGTDSGGRFRHSRRCSYICYQRSISPCSSPLTQ